MDQSFTQIRGGRLYMYLQIYANDASKWKVSPDVQSILLRKGITSTMYGVNSNNVVGIVALLKK